MQLVLRILIYLSLLVGTMWFGYSTYRDYSLLMIDGVGGAEVETVKYAEMETRTQTAVVAEEENPEEDGGLDLSNMLDDEENYRAVRINNKVSRHYVRLIGNTVAFGFLLTVVGFLFAQNIGDVLRFRMNQKIQYVDEYSEKNEDAERGIYLLRKGKHQQALEILRKIVQADPEAWEAQLAIAEHYDKTKENWTQAASDYEDLLQMEMPAEKWGWTAIRLCNIYTGKLDEIGRALLILKRLSIELPETAAGAKAQKRLAMVEAAKRGVGKT
jgi:tetratricopeptide (TPR) repeat protein